jgi:hypothetical protein
VHSHPGLDDSAVLMELWQSWGRSLQGQP